MALAHDAASSAHVRFILEPAQTHAAESGNSFLEARTKGPSEDALEPPPGR